MAVASLTVSQRVAAWLDSQTFASLPREVVDWAQVLLLDTRMVAHAGARLDDVRRVRDLVARSAGRPESNLWGSTIAVPAAEAAFANALAASALDYDSLHANVHPDAMTLAAAWATAQAVHASGKELLRAYVLGSELVCRLSDCTRGPQIGWTMGAVLGTFGAAASAAVLLRLTPAQTAHALGLCLSMAAGSQQTNVEQVLAKRVQPALASRAGVYAALLAQTGVTAPAQVFEGRFGLWTLYFGGDATSLFQDLGQRFSLLQTGLKKYPVCACSHAAMEALLEVLGTAPAEEITHIEAVISPFMERLVGGEFNPSADPQVTAQFSLRYALASIALRRRLGLGELDPNAVRDHAVVEFIRRISLRVDPANTGDLAPAIVRVTLRSGAILERAVLEVPGSVEAPLSMQDLALKYEACSSYLAPNGASGAAAELAEKLKSLERVQDLAEVAL